MFKVLILFLLSSLTFGRGYQFDFNGGLEKNNGSGKRSGKTAEMARFKLMTSPAFFRFHGAYTFVQGSELQQSEFSLGGSMYVLHDLMKDTPCQPYVDAEGLFGVGYVSKVSRMDFGYAVGAGIDIQLGDKWGINLAAQYKGATEISYRLWLGFYWFRFG